MSDGVGGTVALPVSPLVTVIGGGAVGGLLAALLARAGCAVELVVPERYLAAYRDGVRVTTAQGAFRQPLAIRTAPSASAALLVVAVKMPDLETTCRDIGPARPAADAAPGQAVQVEPPVLLLQNGLEALNVAARHIPDERLYAAVVELGATALAPAEITYAIPGKLIVGAARPGQLEAARRVSALLSPAIPTDVTTDVRGAQRLKLLVNLNNGVGAATGLTIQQLYATRQGIKLSLDVMREGLATLDAAGLAPPVNRRSRALRLALGLPDALGIGALRLARLAMRQRAPVYTSTLQSLMRQRPSELRWLNGAIVRLSRECGVPAPLNGAVVAAVEALEARRAGATYVTPAELLRSSRALPAALPTQSWS
ncbi:MAG TPA: 2-dehydropantoate 2-reductase N-terminal domain-containing protein [Chloroflexota bacterium]|jgi:2-dehydropantoate 2-reductase|nr:2-dehydropantoate 2-reductase N-terminal domain-containing protein [Chloroflexota bacterium]